MISTAVARGRLCSAVRTQLRSRIEEKNDKEERCTVSFPESKMPSTQRVVWPAWRPVRVARSSPGKLEEVRGRTPSCLRCVKASKVL